MMLFFSSYMKEEMSNKIGVWVIYSSFKSGGWIIFRLLLFDNLMV